MNVLESASRQEILDFKLSCKSNEFSDNEINHLFLNFELQNENEIDEILSILKQFRRSLYDNFINTLNKK